MLQGSYVCSNSQAVPLCLRDCSEFSLFAGQMVLVHGRNPDGKRFLCKQILEPSPPPPVVHNSSSSSSSSSIQIKLRADEELTLMVAAGPYMTHGSLIATNLNLLIDMAKAKNVHALILVIKDIFQI